VNEANALRTVYLRADTIAEPQRGGQCRIEGWLEEEDLNARRTRMLTREANTLRRQLGIRRPRDLAAVREQTRDRVRHFRERQKKRQLDRRGLVVMLKQMVDKRRNDFSAEAITAALKRPKHYPVALVAELLAELKASGDYDRILAETVSRSGCALSVGGPLFAFSSVLRSSPDFGHNAASRRTDAQGQTQTSLVPGAGLAARDQNRCCAGILKMHRHRKRASW
jgi:hypothetical protein